MIVDLGCLLPCIRCDSCLFTQFSCNVCRACHWWHTGWMAGLSGLMGSREWSGAGTQRVGGLTEAQLDEELSGTRNLGLPQVRPSRPYLRFHRVSIH